MDEDDLDDMAALLGDPEVMRFYPRVRDRAEALEWIHRDAMLTRSLPVGRVDEVG